MVLVGPAQGFSYHVNWVAIAHPVARVVHHMWSLQHMESRTLNVSNIAICPPTTHTVKNIYNFLVNLANLTNQMRVNFKIDTHFQGMRVLVWS